MKRYLGTKPENPSMLRGYPEEQVYHRRPRKKIETNRTGGKERVS